MGPSLRGSSHLKRGAAAPRRVFPAGVRAAPPDCDVREALALHVCRWRRVPRDRFPPHFLYSFLGRKGEPPNSQMRRALAFVLVLLLAALAGALGAHADEPISFWQLPPKTLRLLVASPQVMVSRTSSGWESYCRCPVVLAPAEIPEVMKKAIVAVEDKRYFDHGGVDVITLLSVLKGGFNRGAVPSRCNCSRIWCSMI